MPEEEPIEEKKEEDPCECTYIGCDMGRDGIRVGGAGAGNRGADPGRGWDKKDGE